MLYRRLKFLGDKFRFLYYWVQYAAARLVAPILRYRPEYRHLWIIAERGIDARDNGYHLFAYIRRKAPDVNIRYIISDDSADKAKVEALGNTIRYRSFHHMLAFVLSEVKISTHIMGYAADMYFFKLLDARNPVGGKKVFLQHGITLHNIPYLYAKTTNLDLFVCASMREREFIGTYFGYKNSIARCLGFCRFDALPVEKSRHRSGKILLMPTWRLYLQSIGKSAFQKSRYYQTIQGFLNSEKLQVLLKKYHYQLLFYPHHEIQIYGQSFFSKDKNVLVETEKKADVQKLLIETDILITDYSSVFFDFAYMKKPVLYYQFDQKDFFADHYQKGYFSYERDGFGPVVCHERELIKELETCLKGACEMQEKYQKRVDDFFNQRDHKNCERNYWAVQKLLNEGRNETNARNS